MKQGFTLVELSIVLVIIGLLIGGILVGQSLIESVKINSQIQQVQQFQIMVRNFKDKYAQLPGDSTIINGAIANNDGILDDGEEEINWSGEVQLFWQNLSQLGGLSEQFMSNSAVPSENARTVLNKLGLTPTAKLDKNLTIYAHSDRVNGVIGNYFNIGDAQYDDDDNRIEFSAGVFGEQAAAIDQKIDDGLANSGDVVSRMVDEGTIFFGRHTGGTVLCQETTSTYRMNQTGAFCTISVKFD